MGHAIGTRLAIRTSERCDTREECSALERTGDSGKLENSPWNGEQRQETCGADRLRIGTPSDPTLLHDWPSRPGEQQRKWEAPRLAWSSTVSERLWTPVDEYGRPISDASLPRWLWDIVWYGDVSGPTERSSSQLADASIESLRNDGWRQQQPPSDGTVLAPRSSRPRLGRPTDGSPRQLARYESACRRARLRAWGNAVVPQVVAEIGKAIMKADSL